MPGWEGGGGGGQAGRRGTRLNRNRWTEPEIPWAGKSLRSGFPPVAQAHQTRFRLDMLLRWLLLRPHMADGCAIKP